jgi:Cu+-exporting ATPase
METRKGRNLLVSPGTAIDPVCGMRVNPATAAGHYDYRGTTYYFCARSCLERFKAAPESFLGAPAEPP